MKTYDVRQIISGEKRVVDGNPNNYKAFNLWKKLFKDVTGSEPSEYDIFYAGYILSNPSVRDLLKTKEIKEKYDIRIWG